MAARKSKRAAERRVLPAPGPAPIVTLTTDFGERDPFVGIMKGVILGRAPAVHLVDLTHAVPRQNVVAGAHALASAARWFPRGTIHLVVVDPGVGTARRALVIETADAWFVGPDNGVASVAVPARAVRRIIDVSRSPHRLRPVSRTFHGRDVFAPIAAALASGVDPSTLGPRVRTMRRLVVPKPHRRARTLVGEVLWIDGFGNAVTNIRAVDLTGGDFRGRRLSITIAGHVAPFRPTYAAVPPGRPVALVNSADLLEIAVNGGSAAADLDARVGVRVRVEIA
jgi:S-adenosylmethionine hydrolase